MAKVCPGDFIVLCVPDEQEENFELKFHINISVSRVKDLLPALSSSSFPWIATSVMTNPLQGTGPEGSVAGLLMCLFWQKNSHVQGQEELRSF